MTSDNLVYDQRQLGVELDQNENNMDCFDQNKIYLCCSPMPRIESRKRKCFKCNLGKDHKS